MGSNHASLTHRDRALTLCQKVVRVPTPPHREQEHLFAELDALLASTDEGVTRSILQSPRFRAIRQRLHLVRAEYEYVRERILARAIIAAGSEAPLREFRSAGWYEEAHAFEMRALAPFGPARLLVVGAGPFPTTALSFMRAHPHASVACIERREEACTLALEVARICGCERLQVIHAEALNVSDFSDYDCVIVGTVVGVTDAEKRQVIEHFKSRVPRSTLLVFRTAIGPGTIIYPSVDLETLENIEYRVLVDPPQKTFTSILTDRSDLVS